MPPKLYCGEAKRLPDGYTEMGNRFRCLQRGFGIGTMLEKKARKEGSTKTKKKQGKRVKSKMYCGPKEIGVPDGYDSVGSRYQCMKKGVGAGIYTEFRRYGHTKVSSPKRWDDGYDSDGDDDDEYKEYKNDAKWRGERKDERKEEKEGKESDKKGSTKRSKKCSKGKKSKKGSTKSKKGSGKKKSKKRQKVARLTFAQIMKLIKAGGFR